MGHETSDVAGIMAILGSLRLDALQMALVVYITPLSTDFLRISLPTPIELHFYYWWMDRMIQTLEQDQQPKELWPRASAF